MSLVKSDMIFSKALTNENLCAWLPYKTIELLFNSYQLWGNLQNADPSVIYYDLESPWQWRPLLAQPLDNPLDADVVIPMPIRSALW